MLDMWGFKGGAGESLTGMCATSKEILLYPHPNVRIRHKAGDPAEGVAAYLHTDQLGSVRMVTDDDPDADGSMVARETTYRPFGEAVDFAVSLTPPETKGFIPLSGLDCIKPLPRRRESAMTPTPACNT